MAVVEVLGPPHRLDRRLVALHVDLQQHGAEPVSAADEDVAVVVDRA